MEELDIPAIDHPKYGGIYLPKLKGFLEDAGKVINAVQNLKIGPKAIILATYPRSGTHWVYEMTNMLRQGKSEYSVVTSDAVFVERLSYLGTIQSSNQVVSTHLPFYWLPKDHVETGGKIIYVTRNPKDVAVSLYKLMISCGFIRSDETFENFICDMFLGEHMPYGGWFDHNKEFLKEAAARGNQMIVLQYEKLKKNTVEELRRLAEFLGVEIKDQLLKEIAEKCEFSKLKEADTYVREDSSLAKLMKEVGLNENPIIYRKGEIGDWKNYFTPALNEELQTEFNERMKDVELDYEFE